MLASLLPCSAASDYVNATSYNDSLENKLKREMGIELPPEGEPLPADVENVYQHL